LLEGSNLNNYTLIQDNILINNGYNGSSPYNRQLRIVASNDIKISENMFIIDGYSALIGFDIDGGANSHNITVNDNEFYGNVVGGGKIVQLNGNDVRIRHNVGFVTENSGTAEASHGDWITHGLSGDPDMVQLTIKETDAHYFLQLWATNATDFQIYLFDANASMVEDVDKTINWYAEYEP